jgi:hypothetical protein
MMRWKEKQVAFSDGVLSQISHVDSIERDYELNNISKQGPSPPVLVGDLCSFNQSIEKSAWSTIAGRCLKFIPLSRIRFGRYQ